jgi:iron complex outermembrane receptor protein
MAGLARGAFLSAAAALLLLAPSTARAWQGAGQGEGDGTVTVRVLADGAPLAGAQLRSGGASATSDARGEATLRLPAGERTLTAAKIGFAPASLHVLVRAGLDTAVTVVLERAAEVERVVISATRSGRSVEDEPTRVEVLAREELEEKLFMTPGDIAMLLSETTGLRVQITSPSLGGANVRIQGLRGRYTQVLSDGLPLFGGQMPTFGLLQIPPLDLGQVEVIRGVASALYGSSALGGVINLGSRRPDDRRELLLNQTSRGGTDAAFWQGTEVSERLGYTVLAGLHRQRQRDLDDDGWTDMPGYRRGVLRPRLYWEPAPGRSIFATVGATLEERDGGTVSGAVAPDDHGFPESLDTRRFDGGATGRFLLGGVGLLTVKASGTMQRHRHRFGDDRENDRHSTLFGEAALTRGGGRQTIVAGVALQQERYRATELSGFDYTFTIPAAFAQYDVTPLPWVTVSASGRVDAHSEYGTLPSPRLAALLRAPGGWTARLSAGSGFFAPIPFTEETEVIGLSRLAPLSGLDAERARSASLDVGRVSGGMELRGSLFGSRVERALSLREAAGDAERLLFVNAGGTTRTAGGELLARAMPEPFELTATYTYVRSTEEDPDGGGRRPVPLTPRHSVGVVGAWEQEGRSRVGIELYYVGEQPLADNPYRTTSEPYVLFGVLVERHVGRAQLFANAENIANVRLTRYQRLVRPERGPGGRWTTDAWAPLDGRVINAGVRFGL